MLKVTKLNGRARLLDYENGVTRLTHYVFRYPAKFHPPVVRQLILNHSEEGARILDPFCGSGTLLVEAAVAGRNAVGTDIDPVAVFVARVKTQRYVLKQLKESADRVIQNLARFERPAQEYEKRQFVDLAKNRTREQLRHLWVPQIPNIDHWFRRYVLVDLARIRDSIQRARIPTTHRDFLRLCFAAIIRSASNADPVPVSGLEVTSHMLQRDEDGRLINPFDLFRAAVKKALQAAEEYCSKARGSVRATAFVADATDLRKKIRGTVDTVITSPPYHNAVDYYRRHTLEMYWLGLTANHDERLALLPRYIGRARYRQSHPFVKAKGTLGPNAARWEARIRKVSSERADSFTHYVTAMRRVFTQLDGILKIGGRAVFVVGKSAWNGTTLPTDRLFTELSGNGFSLVDRLWYPVSNRYMSYDRHNGADINREHVLVFERRKQ